MRDGTEKALTDSALMESLKAGEMAALGVLYRRHGRMVRRAVHRFAPEISTAEAEEVSQEVFLEVARVAERYREEQKLKAWLFGIAVNRTRRWRKSTWLRRKLLRKNEQTPVAIASAMEGGPAAKAETRQELQLALASLSEGQREVLILHAVEGFSGEEIATILRIRVATVWTRLHRARERMERALAAAGAGRKKRRDEAV